MTSRKKTTGPRRPVPAKSPAKGGGDRYELRLFVAGVTTRSQQAVRRVRDLCAVELQGRCTLEVIDIFQQPALAQVNQIVATPTLIITRPLPVRRFIGSLTTLSEQLGRLEQGEQGRIAR